MMRRTIYLNRKHALKAPIQDSVLNKCFVSWKVTSVTKDCKIIGVACNTCWVLFVLTFPVLNQKIKKEKRPPKKEAGGDETIFSFGLLNKLNNFARAAHFSHFFVATARIRRENT